MFWWHRLNIFRLFCLLDVHGEFGRLDPDAIEIRIGAGELGTEIENSSNIIDPQQDNDQVSGRAISGACTGNIDADQQTPDHEQHCGKDCAGADIPPFDIGIRKDFKNNTKQHRDDDKADSYI